MYLSFYWHIIITSVVILYTFDLCFILIILTIGSSVNPNIGQNCPCCPTQRTKKNLKGIKYNFYFIFPQDSNDQCVIDRSKNCTCLTRSTTWYKSNVQRVKKRLSNKQTPSAYIYTFLTGFCNMFETITEIPTEDSSLNKLPIRGNDNARTRFVLTKIPRSRKEHCIVSLARTLMAPPFPVRHSRTLSVIYSSISAGFILAKLPASTLLTVPRCSHETTEAWL